MSRDLLKYAFILMLAAFCYTPIFAQEIFLIKDTKGVDRRIQAYKTQVRFKVKSDNKKYTYGKIEEIDNRFVYLTNGTMLSVDSISEIRFKPKYKYVKHVVGTYLLIYGNLVMYSVVYGSNCIDYGCGNIGLFALISIPVFGVAVPAILPVVISSPITIPIEGPLKLRIE